MDDPIHTPVLLTEVLTQLNLQAGGYYIDATINGGGHSRAILDAAVPNVRILGIDRDPTLVRTLSARAAAEIHAGRLRLATADFCELGRILEDYHFRQVDGILFDLGLSSYHLGRSGRGFTFSHDEPLDMRFDSSDGSRETAAEILATRSSEALTQLFRDYGEERFASRIARTIVAERQRAATLTSGQLFALIQMTLPADTRWRAARHAARIFQALRIATNQELDALATALPQALDALAPHGRLLLIAFHSLEDRMVKNFFRNEQHAGAVRVITRKPIQPSVEEIERNPRAASAKLRVAEKLEART